MHIAHRPPIRLVFIFACALLLGVCWQLAMPGAALAQDNGLVVQDLTWDFINPPGASSTTALAGGQINFNYNICNPTAMQETSVVVHNTIQPPTFYSLYGGNLLQLPSLYALADTVIPGQQNFDANLIASGEISVTVGTMEAQECVTFTLKTLVNPLFTSAGLAGLGNTVYVTSDNGRSLEALDKQLSTVVQDLADLQITKVVSPNPSVHAGDLFTYTLYVDNNGPSATRIVSVRDDILSSGAFELVDVLLDPLRASEAYSLTPTPAGGTSLQLVLFDSLEPNSTTQLGQDVQAVLAEKPAYGRWTVQLILRASSAQNVQSCANVFTLADPTINAVNTPDPNPSNNQSCAALDVGATANLSVDTQAGGLYPSGPQFYAGETAIFTTTVINNGPSVAPNVVLKDWLPDGLVAGTINVAVQPLVDVGAAAVQCNVGVPGDRSAPLVCNLGAIPPNMQIQVYVTGQVDPNFLVKWPTLMSADLINNVEAVSSAFDPDLSNNLAWYNLPVWESASINTSLEMLPVTGVAGQDVLYTFTIFNAGPSAARSAIIGAGWTYAGKLLNFHVISGNVLCGPDTDPNYPLECTTPVLGVGDSNAVEIGFSVHVDPGVTAGTYQTSVDLYPYWVPPVFWPVPTNIVTQATLVVTKTASNNMPLAGTQVTFDIAVTNQGPSNAYSVGLNETLPTGLTWLYDDMGCGPDFSACNVGDLAPGQTAKLKVVALVEPDVACGTTLYNQVVATEGVNSYPIVTPVTVQCASDLRVLKFGKPDNGVTAGNPISYTIAVDNLGPSEAYSVTIDDLMVGSMPYTIESIDSNMPVECTPALPTTVDGPGYQQTLRCTTTVDALELFADPNANPNRWLLTVYVTPLDGGSLNNVVSVASANPDPVEANNQATVNHDVAASADLILTKSFVPTVLGVNAGETTEYVLEFVNNGPSVAKNVLLIDALPPALQDVQVFISDPVATCQILPNGSGQQISCLVGALAAGETRSVNVLARLSPDAAAGSWVTNNAMVTADTFDPNLSDNVASATLLVTALSNLDLKMQSLPAAVAAGTSVDYYFELYNPGPSSAMNVVLTDVLPYAGTITEVKVVTGSAACVSAAPNKPRVICSASRMAPNERLGVIFSARISEIRPTGTVTNEVFATSETPGEPSTRHAFAVTEITGKADLVITNEPISVDGRALGNFVVPLGKRVTYRITVVNKGPSTANSVVVSDEIPAGMTYVMDTLGCGAGMSRCALFEGAMGVGEVRTVDVVLEATSTSLCGKNVVTKASTSSKAIDPKTYTNTAKATISVTCAAALATDSAVSAHPAALGKPVTFTFITKNYGPSSALDPRTTIQLAASGRLDVVSVVADGYANRKGATCTVTPQAASNGSILDVSCKANTAIEVADEPLAALGASVALDPAQVVGRQYLPTVFAEGWKQGAWMVKVTVIPSSVGQIAANVVAQSGNPGDEDDNAALSVDVK